MHRIFSGRIGKSSPRRDPQGFLANLVAVTNSAPTAVGLLANSSSNNNNAAKGANSEVKCQDGESGTSSTDSGGSNTILVTRLYTNELISFYTHPNGGRDSEGRTLSDILQFPDRDLERHHDYIQWLFPLPEPSPFNLGAPQIDQPTAEAFRARPELRDRMRESLVRMLAFYGFEVTPLVGQFRIQEVSNIDFQRKARFWLCRFDHNHLRITRIIRCLRVLGLDQEASEFHRVLIKAATPQPGGRGVGERTLIFWTRAAKRPLQVTPMDENFNDEELEETDDDDEFNGDPKDGDSGPKGKFRHNG